MPIWLEDVIEQICIARILRDSKTISGHRLAMILVDNAVEFMVKVYGESMIPGKVLSRKDWEAEKRNFDKLVDHVIPRTKADSYRQQILEYHYVRNDLYHGTAPLSVEPDKINSYMSIAQKILELVFDCPINEEEWKKRTELTQAVLSPRAEKKWLVSFSKTEDGLVRMQKDTILKLKDTEAIMLMIYGFASQTGKAPEDLETLGKCLNYSGHPIKPQRLSIDVSHLRSAGKIYKGELTLTTKARNHLKAKYVMP